MNLTPEHLNLIAIAVTPLVALVFFLLGLTAKRPKLIGGGSGSGTVRVPGKDVMASHIDIRNQPTVLGIKIPRETAKIASARIYDPTLKEYVGPVLKWHINGSTELSQTICINPGKSAKLYLFAKERHADEYFVYNSNALDAELQEPLIKYKDPKKDFTVVLVDEIGRKYRFSVFARHSDQSVGIGFKVTWHARLAMIREAFGLLWRAVTPGS